MARPMTETERYVSDFLSVEIEEIDTKHIRRHLFPQWATEVLQLWQEDASRSARSPRDGLPAGRLFNKEGMLIGVWQLIGSGWGIREGFGHYELSADVSLGFHRGKLVEAYEFYYDLLGDYGLMDKKRLDGLIDEIRGADLARLEELVGALLKPPQEELRNAELRDAWNKLQREVGSVARTLERFRNRLK